jgi:hypothetical protein
VLEALGSRRCNEVYDRGKGEDQGGVEMGRVRMSVWERVKYSFVDGIDLKSSGDERREEDEGEDKMI